MKPTWFETVDDATDEERAMTPGWLALLILVWLAVGAGYLAGRGGAMREPAARAPARPHQRIPLHTD